MEDAGLVYQGKEGTGAAQVFKHDTTVRDNIFALKLQDQEAKQAEERAKHDEVMSRIAAVQAYAANGSFVDNRASIERHKEYENLFYPKIMEAGGWTDELEMMLREIEVKERVIDAQSRDDLKYFQDQMVIAQESEGTYSTPSYDNVLAWHEMPYEERKGKPRPRIEPHFVPTQDQMWGTHKVVGDEITTEEGGTITKQTKFLQEEAHRDNLRQTADMHYEILFGGAASNLEGKITAEKVNAQLMNYGVLNGKDPTSPGFKEDWIEAFTDQAWEYNKGKQKEIDSRTKVKSTGGGGSSKESKAGWGSPNIEELSKYMTYLTNNNVEVTVQPKEKAITTTNSDGSKTTRQKALVNRNTKSQNKTAAVESLEVINNDGEIETYSGQIRDLVKVTNIDNNGNEVVHYEANVVQKREANISTDDVSAATEEYNTGDLTVEGNQISLQLTDLGVQSLEGNLIGISMDELFNRGAKDSETSDGTVKYDWTTPPEGK